MNHFLIIAFGQHILTSSQARVKRKETFLNGNEKSLRYSRVFVISMFDINLVEIR